MFSHGFTWDFFTSLDQSIWFHDYNFRADEWLLLETWTPVASELFWTFECLFAKTFR